MPWAFREDFRWVFSCGISIPYSQLEVGYEPVDIDQALSYNNDELHFASPYPPSTLPTENWPRAQGNIAIYLRPPRTFRTGSDAQVDDFLSSIELPAPLPSPATEAVSPAGESFPRGSSSDHRADVSKYQFMQTSLPFKNLTILGLQNSAGKFASHFYERRTNFPLPSANQSQRRAFGRTSGSPWSFCKGRTHFPYPTPNQGQRWTFGRAFGPSWVFWT